jgi:hypothetical protein
MPSGREQTTAARSAPGRCPARLVFECHGPEVCVLTWICIALVRFTSHAKEIDGGHVPGECRGKATAPVDFGRDEVLADARHLLAGQLHSRLRRGAHRTPSVPRCAWSDIRKWHDCRCGELRIRGYPQLLDAPASWPSPRRELGAPNAGWRTRLIAHVRTNGSGVARAAPDLGTASPRRLGVRRSPDEQRTGVAAS